MPAGTRPFEDVRLELARIGAEKEAARERADATADRLATAIREGKSLEEAASDEDVIVERTGLVRRRADGFVPGLGGSTELLATAFALDEESPSSPQIFSFEGKRALIQLLERVEPEPQLLAETALSEREGLANQKRNAFLQGWIDTRREELAESGDLLVNSSVVQGS